MKKNKSGSLSAKDLDQLMNQAFLNLDFEQPVNQKLLESLSTRALAQTNFFPLFNKIIFNKLILFVSACILADGVSTYLTKTEGFILKPMALSIAPQKQIDQKTPIAEPLMFQLKSTPDKKNSRAEKWSDEKNVAGEWQELITLNGIVKSAKTGERLKGAAIYKLNSGISVTSTEQGYFSLQLLKGENAIGVTLLGYQTYTFSVLMDEDVRKDIELREEWRLLEEVIVKPNGYIFPVLTEKEKKANEKEKQKMAKLAAKLKVEKTKHGEKYPFIPAAAEQSFSAFNIGSTEVTNLEYRTFLFDLLINGKKEEFLAAKPDQNLWIHAADQELFDTLSMVYFSEKKYNGFPVVNISAIGAQMYCNWLSDQANIIRRKEGKSELSARLPHEAEWTYAASGGRKGAVYPWPVDSVQNRVNWFLANCCIQKLTDKLRYPLGCGRKGEPGAYTSAGMVLGDKRIATVESFAYNPNDFYLYCMCGNASEMVYASDKKTIKTKGGNWNSDFEHLKLNSEDEFKTVTSSPMIGFRVCLLVNK